MRVHHFCFFAAAIAALCGMGLGIGMAAAQDFTLAPVHAHVNLLGWVTLCLYGLYHRGVARPSDRLAWVQAGLAAASLPPMAFGLAALFLTGDMRWEIAVIAGSLGTIAAMGLFGAILVLDLRRDAAPSAAPGLSARPA